MIAETLLKAQEQQPLLRVSREGADQADSRVGGADVVEGEGGQRPSTPSSNESEPFEVIDTMSDGKDRYAYLHSSGADL